MSSRGRRFGLSGFEWSEGGSPDPETNLAAGEEASLRLKRHNSQTPLHPAHRTNSSNAANPIAGQTPSVRFEISGADGKYGCGAGSYARS